MKSKTKSTSFWNEIMKGNKWGMLVISIMMFIIYPITLLITISDYERRKLTTDVIIRNLENYFLFADDTSELFQFTSDGYTVLCFTLILGGIMGVVAFSYLHNRTKVGMYHSIPISRNKLLNTKFTTISVAYLIPLFLGNICYILVLFTRAWLTWEILLHLVIFLLYSILVFWMGYLIAGIGMLLTGKIFIGVFGGIVLSFYLPFLSLVLSSLMDLFFQNQYYGYWYGNWNLTELLLRISPVFYIGIIKWNSIMSFLITLLVIEILWVTHKILMKIRPSEVAEKSMAYKKVGDFIKITIVVPASIGVGLFFYEITNSSMAWFYFGTIFGLFVTYVTMQFLYAVEIREIFKQKLQILFITVFTLGVITLFSQDVFGYDSYLPDYDEIVDINIEFQDRYLYSVDVINSDLFPVHMGINEETYELMEFIIQEAEVYSKTSDYVEWEDRVSIYAEYVLENGKTVVREYEVCISDELVEKLKQLWNNEEFLDVMYPIRVLEEYTINDVTIEAAYGGNLMYSELFYNKTSLQKEFLEAYKKDVLAIEASVLEEKPIASLCYILNLKNQNEVWYTYAYFDCYIYPSFVNTLAFFEEQGWEVVDCWQVEDVESVEVTDTIDGNRIYTMSDELSEVLSDLSYYRMTSFFLDSDESKSAVVNMKDDYQGYSAYFIK